MWDLPESNFTSPGFFFFQISTRRPEWKGKASHLARMLQLQNRLQQKRFFIARNWLQHLFVSVAGILLNESYHIMSYHVISCVKISHRILQVLSLSKTRLRNRTSWMGMFYLHLIPSTVSLLGIPQGVFLQIQPFPAENSTKRPFLMLTCNVENHFFDEPLEHDILVGKWRYPEIRVSLNLEISLIRKTTTTLTPLYQLQ